MVKFYYESLIRLERVAEREETLTGCENITERNRRTGKTEERTEEKRWNNLWNKLDWNFD